MESELADLATSFSRALRAEGKSARTVTIHNFSIKFFGDWLVSTGRQSDLEQLTATPSGAGWRRS